VKKKKSILREAAAWFHRWFRRLRLIFIDYKWIILAIVAVIIFFFGMHGFQEASSKSPEFQGKIISWTDLVILSRGLFTGQTVNLVYNPPPSLDIARFLALALSIITITNILPYSGSST
jgi:hypothetical protein